eukprot:s527_g19.t2
MKDLQALLHAVPVDSLTGRVVHTDEAHRGPIDEVLADAFGFTEEARRVMRIGELERIFRAVQMQERQNFFLFPFLKPKCFTFSVTELRRCVDFGFEGHASVQLTLTPNPSPVSWIHPATAMAHTHPLLVLDVGGGTLRLGFAAGVPSCGRRTGRAEPNCCGEPWPKRGGSSRLYGEEVAQKLVSYQLQRPSCRGLLLDLQMQKKIWMDVLSRLDLQGRKLSDLAVLAVLAPLTPEVVVQEVVAILVEDLGFADASVVESSSVALKSPGLSSMLRSCSPSPCCTVLSLGFSACFAQPCVEGKAIASAGRRCPVGGRVLTNLLLESLKLRHYDLSHSWFLAQDILEKTCLVVRDAKQTQIPPKPVTYVLPDNKCMNGYVVETENEESTGTSKQTLTLSLERLIPEALFRPQDFGIPTAGVSELVVQAITAVREVTWRPFLSRLVLCGALARLPGLRQRLQRELRAELPSEWPVELLMEEEPEWSVWQVPQQP